MSVSENWSLVRSRVDAAAHRSGREPGEVTIVAVSKTFPVEVIQEAHTIGVRILGENRVQEALQKMPQLPDDIEWHLVGHLQTNKARQAVGRFHLIHSVDSVHLAQEISRQAAKRGLVQRILIQLNIADEETKSGFEPEALVEAISEISTLSNLQIDGLMTIGPVASNPEDVRWVFKQLRECRDQACSRFSQLRLTELSMGMTADFEVAIEEGATMVRIGRAIFGERTAPNAA